MKKSMYLLMLTVLLYSCTNDQNDFITNEEQQLTTTSKSDLLSSKNSGKVLICHNTGDGFVTIEVNANAVNAHIKHGDINPDSDGDGFTAKFGELNPCNIGDGTDCDDTNADVNPDAEEVCDDAIDNNCNGFYAEYVEIAYPIKDPYRCKNRKGKYKPKTASGDCPRGFKEFEIIETITTCGEDTTPFVE